MQHFFDKINKSETHNREHNFLPMILKDKSNGILMKLRNNFGCIFSRAKNFFIIPLVHWTSNVQILVVRKLNLLVRKNY